MGRLGKENIFWSHFKTIFYFMAFLLATPFIFFAFIVVTLYHKTKLLLLSSRFKYLDFARSNTIRTLMDTSRNPGVLHFLMKVKGECDLEEIRNAYMEHLLDKRDKNLKFLFPRLRTLLISCWGQYAFIKNFDDFKIENHIIMGPTSFNGKSICEENIQKCISFLVSKYMPSDFSPWQIKLIPYSDHSAYYLLIRIHHLILDEQKNLTVGDMMLLDRSKGSSILCKELNEGSKYLKKSPLTEILRHPTNMITIYEDFCEFFISRWNEFLYKHDSLEHFDKEGYQPPENFGTLLPSLIMTCVNVYYDYKQHGPKIFKGTSDPQRHLRFIFHLLSKELSCRQINGKLILNLFLNAFHPVNLILNVGQFIIQTIAIWIFLSPVYAMREFNAMRIMILMREEIDTSTYFGFLCKYIPLIVGSVKEIFYFAEIIFTAPRTIIEEVFLSHNDDSHYLNTSLCGRKNVSWSEAINVSDLKAVASNSHRSYSEVMLATISTSLLNFFKQLKKEGKTRKVPSMVKCNMRWVPFSYLYGFFRPSRNGVIGMNLPLTKSNKSYEVIHDQINEARKHQVIVYLTSLIQIRFDFLTTVIPSVWLKLAINFVSKKFSISITEMYGIDEFEPNEYVTCYKGEIEDIIFFRTPQANNSASIIIQRFMNQIRVNIMCDSNIENQHIISDGVRNAFINLMTN